MQIKQSKPLYTYLALIWTVIFWGLSFVATKVALESLPTFTLIFARFSIASVFFALLIAKRGFPSFTGKEHGKVFLVALFEPGLYFIFETYGLQYTAAPKASLIIATVPVAVLVFAALLLGERTDVAGVMGIVLSLFGITVLVAGDPQFTWNMSGPLFGDILILGAVISAALYMVSARDLGRTHSSFEITSLQIIYGALLYTPAFLWELPGVDWSAITGRSLCALLYLTIFATIAGFLLYNYALTRIPASRASVFINGIPVVTAVGAWIILGETLTFLQAGGGLLVMLGVYLSNRPRAT